MSRARWEAIVVGVLISTAAGAQTTADSALRWAGRDTVGDSAHTHAVAAPKAKARHFHIVTFLAGGLTSLALHEAGHITASYLVGAHPSFAFNKGRPTIYSGINADLDPQKQFIFSSAGLTVQTVLDEAILDVPHDRGSTFERGILFGGLSTTAFYLTVGRDAHVSDVYWMTRTSSLSKWGVTAIYGPIAALQVIRIHFNGAYAHFFTSPGPPMPGPRGTTRMGSLNIGVKLTPTQTAD
jgi:hypothetical protein